MQALRIIASLLRSAATKLDGFDPEQELNWERGMYRTAVKGMNRYCVRVEAYVRLLEDKLRVFTAFETIQRFRREHHRWNAGLDFDDPKGTYRLGDDMMKNLGL